MNSVSTSRVIVKSTVLYDVLYRIYFEIIHQKVNIDYAYCTDQIQPNMNNLFRLVIRLWPQEIFPTTPFKTGKTGLHFVVKVLPVPSTPVRCHIIKHSMMTNLQHQPMTSFMPSLFRVFHRRGYGDSYLIIKLPCKSVISNEILQKLLVNRLSIHFQIGNVMVARYLMQFEMIICIFAHVRIQRSVRLEYAAYALVVRFLHLFLDDYIRRLSVWKTAE